MNQNQPLPVVPVASKLKLFFQNPNQNDIVSKAQEIEKSVGEIIGNVLMHIARMIKKIDVQNWEANAQDPMIENPAIKDYPYAVTVYVELSDHSRGLEQSEIEETVAKIKKLIRMVVGIDLVGSQFAPEAFIAFPMERPSKSTQPVSASSGRQQLVPR